MTEVLLLNKCSRNTIFTNNLTNKFSARCLSDVCLLEHTSQSPQEGPAVVGCLYNVNPY